MPTGEERRGAVCGKIACTVRCRRREETRLVGKTARPRRLPPTLPRPVATEILVMNAEQVSDDGRASPRYAVSRNLELVAAQATTRNGRCPGRGANRPQESAVRHRLGSATDLACISGKRRTTGMKEGNERVLHRRFSELRWP